VRGASISSPQSKDYRRRSIDLPPQFYPELSETRLFHSPYSHSIFPGGFDVMSQVTRLIPRTSLMILLATRPKKAC
jgi:hypothetical protein